MAGKKGHKKRFWLDDEKRTICGQARVSGVSVAQVARRYGMNANLIHKWLKDERFAPEPEADEGALFLPLEIDGGGLQRLLLRVRFWHIGLISLCRMAGVYWWKVRRACLLFWLWSKG